MSSHVTPGPDISARLQHRNNMLLTLANAQASNATESAVECILQAAASLSS